MRKPNDTDEIRISVRSPCLLAIGFSLACQQPEPLPQFGTLRYESENFEIWASEGLQACGGTFDYTEQWLAAFRDRVGEHDKPARHTFYWLSPDDLATEPCSIGTACAYPDSNVIYSPDIPNEHEIVHTELDAQPPPILREGAAEVFGSRLAPLGALEPGRHVDIEALIDADPIPAIGYQPAGRFSRFLIDRYGIDAYFQLYEALDDSQGQAEFAAGVEETLGVELTTLVDELERAPSCPTEHWRFFDYECFYMPLTPWTSPMLWSDQIDMSCTAPDVVGPSHELIWTRRALEIEEAGLVTLTIESEDATAMVAIFECNLGCFDHEPEWVTPPAGVGRSTTFYLRPGRHWLQVEHAASSSAPATVTIER